MFDNFANVLIALIGDRIFEGPTSPILESILCGVTLTKFERRKMIHKFGRGIGCTFM